MALYWVCPDCGKTIPKAEVDWRRERFPENECVPRPCGGLGEGHLPAGKKIYFKQNIPLNIPLPEKCGVKEKMKYNVNLDMESEKAFFEALEDFKKFLSLSFIEAKLIVTSFSTESGHLSVAKADNE